MFLYNHRICCFWSIVPWIPWEGFFATPLMGISHQALCGFILQRRDPHCQNFPESFPYHFEDKNPIIISDTNRIYLAVLGYIILPIMLAYIPPYFVVCYQLSPCLPAHMGYS